MTNKIKSIIVDSKEYPVQGIPVTLEFFFSSDLTEGKIKEEYTEYIIKKHGLSRTGN